jgi:hypothetical protein
MEVFRWFCISLSVKENKMTHGIGFKIVKSADSYKQPQVTIFQKEVPNNEARMAFCLLEKWGPVCSTFDGETSEGHFKTRPLTPEETVDRAFAIARHAFRRARAEGMMLELPDLNGLAEG